MHIVILEDEPVIAQRLERLLKDILVSQKPRMTLIDNLDDAESYLSENTIDLLFLDLNLHGADGFELLKLSIAQSFHTIIVSAYAEQAINAFEFGVLDFVAKPFNRERLEQAVNRALKSETKVTIAAKKLAVKKTSGIQLIDIKEVLFIKADGHYSQVHLADKQQHLHDKSIEKLTILLPDNFERIHRSYIVNMTQIRSISIESGGSYHAVMGNGLAIPISRSRYAKIRDLFEGL